jgi:hypothetical protein
MPDLNPTPDPYPSQVAWRMMDLRASEFPGGFVISLAFGKIRVQTEQLTYELTRGNASPDQR